MLPPLTASQTLERARAMLESGRGAALPELLELIQTLSLNICEVTIPELAELIEKDAVVLAKVISVANTLAHNPGIAPITTLSQAIHQIGYNRIRTVAVSLMLLESAGSGSHNAQREAAAFALCAGLVAHGTAAELGTHDPEFAFACAALRNFGHIVMATISPEHCQAAAKHAPQQGIPAAYRTQFGLTPLDLSRRLLTAARLPTEVLDALRDCEPTAFAGVTTTHDARLLGIAEYSSRLAALALDSHESPHAFAQKAKHLGQQFARLVPGAAQLARPALHHADLRLSNFSRSTGTRALPTSSLQRVHRRVEQLGPESPAESGADYSSPVEPAAPLPALAEAPPPVPTPEPEDPITTLPPPALAGSAAPWDAALTASHAFGATPLTPDPLEVAFATLTLARDTLGATDCWLFRTMPGHADCTLSDGVGPAWSECEPGALIRASDRSVFGVTLSRREIVVIHDSNDPAILPYLPEWWRALPQRPLAFLLIPIEVMGEVRAVVLAGWPAPRRITVEPARVNVVRQLTANFIVTAPPVAA